MEASPVRFGALEATLVSEAVLPMLRRGGVGRVHSVFASVVNLEVDDHLVTVTGPSSDPLPNGIRTDRAADFRTADLLPGWAVVVDGSRIAIPGAGLVVGLSRATPWSPRLARGERDQRGEEDPSVDNDRARWRSRAARVRALAAALVVRRTDACAGLGPLLSPIVGSPFPAVAALTAPRLARLGAALRTADAAGASVAGRELLGLGPGLTPSGDDALVGVAAGIVALARDPEGVIEFLVPVAHEAPARTTAIAATYLRHAAAGEFAGRIHRLLGALLGTDDEAVAPAIERALAWGATSGTDTLVGILTGLDVAAGLVAPAIRRAA